VYFFVLKNYSGAYLQQSLNTRIDESNVGHQLLKKMGEFIYMAISDAPISVSNIGPNFKIFVAEIIGIVLQQIYTSIPHNSVTRMYQDKFNI
jgi:hypothetical protein